MYSGYQSLIRYMISNIFSQFLGCVFTLLIVSFDAHKFSDLMKSNLPIFSLVTCVFGVISKKSLSNLMWQKLLFSVYFLSV